MTLELESKDGVKEQAISLSDYQSKIDSTFNWTNVEWLKTITKLPLILKGIQSYADAKKAASLGVHVWVSNHGGRQLDTVRSTIEML